MPPGALLREPFRNLWKRFVARGADEAGSVALSPGSAGSSGAPGSSGSSGAPRSAGGTASTRAGGAREAAAEPGRRTTASAPNAASGSAAPPRRERSQQGDAENEEEGDEEEEATEPAQPTTSAQAAAAGEVTGRSDLTFAKDEEGDYATYALKRGEALYSAVVVRFTGRIEPDDVAGAAAIIAHRSGIRVTTSIPVGYAVKIPRDMLLPEFLPSEDRKRKAVERTRKETARVRNPVRSRNLDGIHVILDAGHGGIDPGALIGGISEHEYVYDVLCRVKRRLETQTGAVVHPTISDPSTGFNPRPGRLLRISGNEKILTTPAHVNDDRDETILGVNLRWFLANAIRRRLVASGVDPSKIVFVSFHADVLHASLRGAMIYVPGEQYRRGTYGCRDRDCARYGEVREAPAVHFTRSERVSSEGLSRQFAADLLDAFRARGIGIHPYLPVRDRIIRDGRTWLPAVLRGNSVPVKVLVEIANLNNAVDRARIQDAEFRESVARAFTDALLHYYTPSSAPSSARRRRAPPLLTPRTGG